MPRRRRQKEDLIHAATLALEDEIRCWRQLHNNSFYGHGDKTIRLVRTPSLYATNIGPADVIPETASIEHIDLPEKEVPYFLRYRGMEAAIKKIRELEA
ncbi:hypothetical protein QA639_21465 [Bradyrhizobium pachyrhizi]|uniref:hypothetical protein n=1 Tax=Bradyrhizobium pachyrhizi TaxID=280333 RepID=UPI0024B23E61|nr:hypothetical protein [Bradyrhizobium pachyrhizi]WFU52280.1 hypothetical protein QA639_21465 [Bradyrhizobium pachyrhizi]